MCLVSPKDFSPIWAFILLKVHISWWKLQRTSIIQCPVKTWVLVPFCTCPHWFSLMIILENRTPKIFKRELKTVYRWNRWTINPKPTDIILFNWFPTVRSLNSIMWRKKNRTCLLSESTIFLMCENSILHKTMSCGPHFNVLRSLNINLWTW